MTGQVRFAESDYYIPDIVREYRALDTLRLLNLLADIRKQL